MQINGLRVCEVTQQGNLGEDCKPEPDTHSLPEVLLEKFLCFIINKKHNILSFPYLVKSYMYF